VLRVREADGSADLAGVGRLFEEYAGSLGFDLGFQGFAAELAGLPGDYAPPAGCLLLAFDPAAISSSDPFAGCVALRPLEPGICEMKRLYLRPAFRGLGGGRLLAEAVIAAARARGYQRMRLDTVPSMQAARTLYAALGFRGIAPYRHNPIPETAYMELDLTGPT
jgi:ribosomal protein S18 acetylase RimI-like enzyme